MDILKLLSESVDKEVLTEDLKKKIADGFEVAIEAKVQERLETTKKELEESIKTSNNEEMITFKNNIIDTMDKVIDESINEFIAENKEGIEEATKSEMANDFFGKIKSLFESQSIEIPTEDKSMVESLKTENESLKKESNTRFVNEQKLIEKVRDYQQVMAFNEKTKDMTEIQIEEAKEFMDTFACEDIQDFNSKLSLVIEKIVEKPSYNKNKVKDSKILTEDNDNDNPDSVDKYLKTL